MLKKPEDLVKELENPGIVKRREIICSKDNSFDKDSPPFGLALSGGGIRSATFCLGVLRGLARNGVLRRFDYLSTVSGGGYIGAALGRMYQRLGSVEEVEKELEKNDSASIKWLRFNGRYLTPAGTKDWGILIAAYLRSWLAIQWEFFLLATLLCSVIILPHVLGLEFVSFLSRDIVKSIEDFLPSPWFGLALIVLTLAGPWQVVCYWLARSYSFKSNCCGRILQFIFAAVAVIILLVIFAVVMVIVTRLVFSPCISYIKSTIFSSYLENFLSYVEIFLSNNPLKITIYTTTILGSFSVVTLAMLYMSIRRVIMRDTHQISQFRNKRTKGFRKILVSAFLLVLFGFLDRGSWELWQYIKKMIEEDKLTGVDLGSILGISVIVLSSLRAVIESFGRRTETTQQISSKHFSALLLDLAGGLSVAISLLLCGTILQWAVLSTDLPQLSFLGMSQISSMWCLIAGTALLWIFMTGYNKEWINSSSLHAFYRARLARAYLGVGNEERQKPTAKRVDDFAKGDDILLGEYHPEKFGGPLHLINLCLNETQDSSPYGHGPNRDRKARPVTISSHMVEVSKQARPFSLDEYGGSLAQWVSVSGAAASSGAGSHTHRGWALLMYLFGARLGFWAPQFKINESAPKSRHSLSWEFFPKLAMQWSELTATYDTAAPYCLLSDGGHFENTGVYPLIGRKLPFILLVDCGADPQYRFDDLQKLIRRARIDHDAEITFYDSVQAAALFPASKGPQLCILSPKQMSDNTSARGVMLARIQYNDDSFGTLLVIKPNLHDDLPLDMAVYARENPNFPQQPTADQFFDEAQWESYQRLGLDFGLQLTDQWLATLPNWKKRVKAVHPKGTLDPVTLDVSKQPNANPQGKWRVVSGSAVGAGVGAGAMLAVMVPILQYFSEYQKNKDKEDAEYADKLLKPISCHLDEPEKSDCNFSANAVAKLKDSLDKKQFPEDYKEEANNVIKRLSQTCGGENKFDYCNTLDPKKDDAGPDNARYWQPPETQSEKPPETQSKESVAFLKPPFKPSLTISQVYTLNKTLLDLLLSKEPPPDVQQPPPDNSPYTISQACASSDIKIRLYPQVYDDCSTKIVNDFKTALNKAIDVQPTENVVYSARRAGRREPFRWTKPTFVVHYPAQNECADKLVEAYRGFAKNENVQKKSLPSTLKGTPGMIELWLPEDKACKKN